MRTRSEIWKNQQGAVAPFVAIMLLLLVVIVALVVDIGHVINAKNQLQQAVDASALAGAGQLNSLSDAADRAVAAANTIIIENDVLRRDVDLGSENVVVTLGYWDTDALGEPFEDRWSPGETPYNAVHVQADVVVDYFFPIRRDSATVPVDALAVQDRTDLTLPLALISCIPPTGPQAGELNVCGIKTYDFDSNENTAGWTALTLSANGGASQQDIAPLFDADGSVLFNQIVTQLNETAVATPSPPWNEAYIGCEGNVGETINCGLGGDFDTYSTLGDPLTRYTSSGLPRYITTSMDELHGFADILSQDGNLFPKEGVDFQAQLASLYNGVDRPFGDNRFMVIDGEEQLINYVNDKYDFNRNGITNEKVYVPNFNRSLDYAGYPPVGATTGAMSTVMDKLLDLITPAGKKKKDIQFSNANTDANPPFDSASSGGEGDTLLFTVPVIFAGLCGGFDPKSIDGNPAQEGGELHYVGLANFLITRIWKGGDCYECTDPVVLNSTGSGLTCNDVTGEGPTDHIPSLLNGNSYACPVSLPTGPIAFEGLIRPPGFGAGPTGVRAVTYLVE